LNTHLLDSEAQAYINSHLNADVHHIAMAKSPIAQVEARELAAQIAAKQKAMKKLPTWYHQEGIYYPSSLSVEQTSSETTALYKSKLAVGDDLIDLTGGFGVDSFFFAKRIPAVTHCEINPELSEIAAHNAKQLGSHNINFIAGDGLEYLNNHDGQFGTIYIDPARRSSQGKVFKLADCTPNVVQHLDLLLKKADRIIIKTAPLLDISAGLKELKHVAEVHIVSTKNEVKELLWIIEREIPTQVKIVAVTLNEAAKSFSFFLNEEVRATTFATAPLSGYVYEPDTALLKSGAFNLIAERYGLQKLDQQTQLYVAETFKPEFPGRIFKISEVMNAGDLKKQKDLIGNVISRNYQERAENLVKKYKIKADQQRFLLFTQSKSLGFIIIAAEIEQHY